MNLHQGAQQPDLAQEIAVERICHQFESALRDQQHPRIEEYLKHVDTSATSTLLRYLLSIEIDYKQTQGESLRAHDYTGRFPGCESLVTEFIRKSPDTYGGSTAIESMPAAEWELCQPQTIGRYRIDDPLGQGAFGQVFLVFDADLNRRVAIKIPHPRRVQDAS